MNLTNGVVISIGENFEVSTENINNEGLTSNPEIEKPKEISIRLDKLRELEKQSDSIGSSPRPDNSGSDHESLFPKINGDNVELPSPDKLFKWLDSIPPIDRNKLAQGIQSEHQGESVHKINTTVDNSKFILIVCVSVGALVFLMALGAIYIVCKKNFSSPKHVDKIETKTHVHESVFTVEGQDTFMGIPTNNQIWKELQMLPPTASSVLPESKDL